MTRTRTSERGFTLIETVFALAIMAGGLLSLAAVFSYGMLHLNTGTSLLTAKEKATEAIESVFMSRDTLVITWGQVRNQAGRRDLSRRSARRQGAGRGRPGQHQR